LTVTFTGPYVRFAPSNQSSLILGFNTTLPKLFEDNLANFLKLAVPSHNLSAGVEKAERTENYNSSSPEFEIPLNMSFQLPDQPDMNLQFTINDPFLLNNESFVLTALSLWIKIPLIYKLTESEKSLSSSSSNASATGQKIASNAMVVQNILGSGSSLAVKSLMLMEVVRIFRFLKIK
jgi:hypothetical protein